VVVDGAAAVDVVDDDDSHVVAEAAVEGDAALFLL
jgi:hypothetical protein